MRTIQFLIVISLVANQIKAQDVITKKDSSKLNTTILEINPTEIKYNLFNYANGPKITLRKEEVAYIIYKNGVVERLAQAAVKQTVSDNYYPDKYNLDRVPVGAYSIERKIKNCEKLYNKKNYLGFNYITFLNTCLGFNYMRDIRKASLILNVPFCIWGWKSFHNQ